MKLIFYAKIFTQCVGRARDRHTGVCSIILTAVHIAEQSGKSGVATAAASSGSSGNTSNITS